MQKLRKPKLGQNFLVDVQARQSIVEALGDLSDRTVVEIGPGHGALTDLLAARCRRLIALELDRSLAAELRFRFRAQEHVDISHADVLATNFATLTHAGETLDVIGNLPYGITSDILLHLFASAPALRRAVLMMQREVADRVSAPPGVRDYGALSALTHMHAEVSNLFTLPPSAFNPPPEVYSTVLRLEFAPRFAELAVQPEAFNHFLRQAFAQKRKTLHNNLRHAGFSAETLSERWPASIPPQSRAEQLPLQSMAELFRSLGGASFLPGAEDALKGTLPPSRR